MNFHEDKLNQTQVKATNTSGATYVQGQIVLEQGFLGNVVDDLAAGIVNGATFTMDINSNRTIQTDQIKVADTFAESVNGNPASVYFDRTNAWLTETNGAGFVEAGFLTKGGAKDAEDFINFKPLPQVPLEGSVPPGSIDTADIADDAVTNDKLNNISQGFIKVGGASDAPTDLDAKTDAQILVGDGTDLNSVAVSGDVTIANTGAVTIGAKKVLSSMVEDTLIKTLEMTLTAAEVKALYSANTNKGHEIIAAPGAGLVIEFISAALRYNYDGSNAYTAANGLTFNVEAVAVSDLIAVTFLQGAADRVAIVQALSAEIDQDLSAITNKALYLQEGTTDPTGAAVEADTIKLRVAYRVHSLAV